MNKSKTIDLKEFRDAGYLLEANRQFFHPLGLALGIYWDEDDLENKKGVDVENSEPQGLVIFDWRDDPEGCAFASLTDDDAMEKINNVAGLWDERAAVRLERLGWVIQPPFSTIG